MRPCRIFRMLGGRLLTLDYTDSSQIHLDLRRGHSAAGWKNRRANARKSYAFEFFGCRFSRSFRIHAHEPLGPAVGLRRFVFPANVFAKIPWADFQIDALRESGLEGNVLDGTAAHEVIGGIEITSRYPDLCRQTAVGRTADRAEEVQRNDRTNVYRDFSDVRAIHAPDLDGAYRERPRRFSPIRRLPLEHTEHSRQLLLLLCELLVNLVKLLLLPLHLLLGLLLRL